MGDDDWPSGRAGLFAFSAGSAAAATTFKVNSTADESLASTGTGPCENDTSGCTLRAAVELAVENDGATIEVPAGTYTEELPSPTLVVKQGAAVTIVGEGAASTIIEGKDRGSVFEVQEAGSRLTLDGVTIRGGGDVDEGGGIYDAGGVVTVENSTVTENEANDVGGGIYAAFEGTISVKHSTMTQDRAEFGGAIYSEFEGETTVEGSTLSEDEAEFGFGFGGAIYTEVGGTTKIHDSTFEEDFAASGGAVFAENGSSVQIDGSTLDHNGAEFGGAVSEEVRDEGECGTVAKGAHSDAAPGAHSALTPTDPGDGFEEGVAVEHTTIDANGAERGGGVYVGIEPDECGGVKQATHSAGAHPAGPSVHPDISGDFVEGTLTVVGTAIEHNEAGEEEEDEGWGGGIYSELATVTITQESTVAHNEASRGGGGIYGWDSYITIAHSTIDENTATSEDGGGIAVESEEDVECLDGHPAAHADAAAEEGLEGTLTVEQSTIDGNLAGEDQDGDGGGVYSISFPVEECDQARAAHHSAGGAQASAKGAAAALGFSETGLTIEQSTIANNRAGSDGGGDGGGIYEAVEFDPIVNSTIADNVAGDEGGGVYSEEDGVAALISDTVDDNTTESGDTGNNLAGGISGAIELRDTIVAEEPGENQQNCEGNVHSLVSEAGYNLDYPSTPSPEGDEDECGMSEGEHDLVDTNPALSSEGLHENGGPTETIALLSTSPAIGFAPVKENCESTETGPGLVDQRGEKRPGIPGDGCDVGAYEYQGAAAQAPAKQAAKEESKKEEPKNEEPAKQGVLGIKITSPLQCASKRKFTIHIQNVKQFGIVSAVVTIDGKHKRTLTGDELKTAINLHGYPKGTFTVEIVAHTASGQTLRGKRVYHTCRLPLPGQRRLRL